MNNELMEFMVGKRTAGTPNQNSNVSPQTPHSSSSNHNKNSNTSSQRKSKTSSIFSSFSKVLVLQWLDADSTAEEVLRSIVNLQDRISQELVMVDQFKYQPQQPRWKSFGFRSSPYQGLTLPDIEMTLDRDLMQHEAMLAHLRHCSSTMSKAQDSMGRRLSEWYAEDPDDASTRGQPFYSACAKELYRKQNIVQSICDAFADDIGSHKSSTIAKGCLSKWKKSHKESYLLPMLEEIQVLQQRFDE